MSQLDWRTSALQDFMELNGWRNQDVADICDVSVDDVLTWLDPNDPGQFVIPKNKLPFLTTFANELERTGMSDAQAAKFCDVPLQYIDLWRQGSLTVPHTAMIKMIREGR